MSQGWHRSNQVNQKWLWLAEADGRSVVGRWTMAELAQVTTGTEGKKRQKESDPSKA